MGGIVQATWRVGPSLDAGEVPMMLRHRNAFSLVECLVVIWIIALLLQLLLPAIQAAREAARRSTCQNSLRQIGLAALNHESSHQAFPTAGWGWGWIGDPDRGIGEGQPGSWRYQLLPFLEQQNIYQVGAGLEGSAKYDALTQMATMPVSLFYCPTRRPPLPTPNMYGPVSRAGFVLGDLFWYNARHANELARSDYAANIGDRWAFWREGPSPDEAKRGVGFFELRSFDGSDLNLHDLTGIVFQRRPVRAQQVTDGLSHTLFGGEKAMFVLDYESGQALNDDQSAWNGDDWDGVASTEFIPRRDPVGTVEGFGVPFGGPHTSGVAVVYCDGSGNFLAYDIDPEVHRRSGNRADDDGL